MYQGLNTIPAAFRQATISSAIVGSTPMLGPVKIVRKATSETGVPNLVHRSARLDTEKVLRSAVVCVELRLAKHCSQVLGVGVGVGVVLLPGAAAAC